ncbi:MAG: lytic transglycosylase domain-containing protein [Caldilineaceae bacterium]|nr:lytic transglycosylase domain-containing protein [Caldilineaceae bacterium]HRJ42408.1 lytic transglycosylase domain-containing protein [Caldilineaceae bacterium]
MSDSLFSALAETGYNRMFDDVQRLLIQRLWEKARLELQVDQARQRAGQVNGLPPSTFDSLIDEAARRHGVDADLVKSVIKVESNFDPSAVSHAGAKGLMQLMDGTAAELGVRDSFDVAQNIDGGVAYLAQQLRRFQGDERLALAAYNAGPGAVQRHGGIPPFAETQAYVQRVLSYYNPGETRFDYHA